MFKTWDQLTVVEQLQCTYSDLYKDVHGFRPRGVPSELLNSETWLNQQLDSLELSLRAIIEQDRAREQISIVEFEKRVTDVIAMGAKDRKTALRWIMDGSEADGDWQHLSYLCNLPYDYFQKETV